MTRSDAQKIVEALAAGMDPETGAPFGPGSPLDSPHVIRALFFASQSLGRAQGRESSAKPRPVKAGKPWSNEEDDLLLQDFDGGKSVRELAQRQQRSPGGIASRLVRLGRIEERAEVIQRADA
jgi:hypothetical protein